MILITQYFQKLSIRDTDHAVAHGQQSDFGLVVQPEFLFDVVQVGAHGGG